MIDNIITAAQELAGFLPKRDRDAFDKLLDVSSEVVAFGSRAAKVHSRSSDLDILCISENERFKSARLDIVSRTPSEVEHQKWLGSELAGHIAAFGVVIRGRAEWRGAVSLSEAAVSRKERRLISLVDGLWTYWDRLHPEFRLKHLTTIRREAQRLQLLVRRDAVPPTPILDREWNDYKSADRWARSFLSIKSIDVGWRDRLLRTTDLIIEQRR